MATLTLTLVIGANTLTRSVTFSNADAGRLQAAYAALYPPDDPAVPLTAAQVFDRLAKGIFAGMKANVLAHENAVQQPAETDLLMT
jgi:hypothetical protein